MPHFILGFDFQTIFPLTFITFSFILPPKFLYARKLYQAISVVEFLPPRQR